MLQGNMVTEERRAYERLLVRCPVRFKTKHAERLNKASAKDLSDQGLGFFTRTALLSNTDLEVWIGLFPQLKSIHVHGRMIWSKRISPTLWRGGVSFEGSAYLKVLRMMISKYVK
ncbi:MAG: PilZ domain-containing protein [Candidatus Omnitrophica bacterium]|nr:PilZ domain-containing protein [Candidatus Omnitrophota bacterium]